MASLSIDQINDLVVSTQEDLGRMKWEDISLDYTDYPAFKRLMRKNKAQYSGGDKITWRVVVKLTGNARWTGLYDKDQTDVQDVLTTAEVPWRHNVTSYGYDVRELKINRGQEYQIVDLVKIRRVDALKSLAELFEFGFWSAPTSSSDKLKPFGVPYWIVKASAVGDGGFDGGNPSGFTDGAAGISSSTYSNWSNWSAGYEAISKTDLIRKMREAYVKTNFKPPIDHPSHSQPRSTSRFGLYCNYDVLGTVEELLEEQNDNLGNDVASKDGVAVFRRIPFEYVPYLDDDDDDPIYGIDWGTFHPVFLRGEYMRESKPMVSADSHNVYEVFVDNTMNFKCLNRRCNFVMNLV